MKNRKMIGFIVICLTVMLVTQAASAIRIPPPPRPPPVSKPTISSISYISLDADSVKVKAVVYWHYSPYYGRDVYVSIGGASYVRMSNPSGNLRDYEYTKNGLNPSSTYTYRVKAMEVWPADGDILSATSYSATKTIAAYNPTLSVSFIDATDIQATFSYSVASWGRGYTGLEKWITFAFRHAESANTWDIIETETSTFSGTYILNGLAMDNNYEYSVTASYRIDNSHTASTSKSGSFATDDWTPNRKYAIILLTNGDQSEGSTYDAHVRAYNDILAKVNSAGFDYIYAEAYVYQHTNVDFLEDLNYSSTAPVPSDESSFVFIYIIGHGDTEGIYIGHKEEPEHYATDDAIDAVLDGINCGKLVIGSETCGFGGMIDVIGGSNRVIIAGSDDKSWMSMIDGVYRCIFSYYFAIGLGYHWSFYDAAIYAASMVEPLVPNQDPMIDDCYPYDGSYLDYSFLAINGDGQLANGMTLQITSYDPEPPDL